MTKDKRPHLQMSVRYSLKDMPEGYRGLVGENWTYGKVPVPFSKLALTVVQQIGEFYCMFTDVATMNVELEKLRTWLAAQEVRMPQEAGDA